ALFWVGRDALNVSTGPEEGMVEVASTRLVPVYVAARDLPRGTRVAEDDLRQITVLDGLGPEAPRRPEQILGRVVTSDTPEGQLLLGDILSLNPADAGLAPLIPVGQRAFSLRVDESIAAGDFLRPGDRVDVLIVLDSDAISQVDPFTRSRGDEALTLLQNVTVLTVGGTLENQQNDDDDDRRTRVRTVSIAVEPEDGDLLALARELGEYAIALRNPEDEAIGTRTAVTAVDLRARLLGLDAQSLLVQADQPEGLENLFGAGFDLADAMPEAGAAEDLSQSEVAADTASEAQRESLDYVLDPSAPVAEALAQRPRLPDTVRPVAAECRPPEVEETPVRTLPADQQNLLLEALTALLTPAPHDPAPVEAPQPAALACPEPVQPVIRTVTIRSGTNASTQTIEHAVSGDGAPGSAVESGAGDALDPLAINGAPAPATEGDL
ncbi:MAG: Flp pilus assembly protein CpaB, partial [Azospirillaceae bacterium]